MTGILDRARELVARLYSADTIRPTVGAIPDGQCSPSQEVGKEIIPNQSYFTVIVNEIFLATGRQLWATYDPMVLAIVECVYNRQIYAIPVVIGPSMIRKLTSQETPHGFVINDAVVAGPHPYRGGKVTITLLLFRVKHTDYARSLLRFAENISKAVGVPAELNMLQKVGSALLDGVDDLLKLRDSEPVAGHMFTIDGSTRRGFRTGYAVLMPDSEAPVSKLRVNAGRLEIQDGGALSLYRNSDYVLYSVTERPKRGEIETLSFYPLLDQSIQAALANDDESWKRAKAALLSLYGQMVSSPDLIFAEVESLSDEFTKRVLAARERAKAIDALSYGERDQEVQERALLIKQMNSRMHLLELM